jgi:hypothetical protein
MLGWDFDRIVVGHREPLLVGAKSAVANALAEFGSLSPTP